MDVGDPWALKARSFLGISKKQLPSEEYRRLCSLLYHLPGQVRSFLRDESRKAIIRRVFEEVVFLFTRSGGERKDQISAPCPRDALTVLTEFLPTMELKELLDSVVSAAIRQQASASSSSFSRTKERKGDTSSLQENARTRGLRGTGKEESRDDRSFSQIRERRKLAKRKGRFPGCFHDGTTVSLLEGVRANESNVGSPSDPSSQSIRAMVTCHICQGILKDPYAAACGHVCCFICWEKCLSIRDECPICRRKVSSDSLRKLFLG
eukprot:TRINITY_DN32869_c0_g3_i1.p1 TRINITY_DN32869_c0_g3~~TRINITY_DN32869_c0_g3_i1.p1  ORF type:complete len:278 (-),score=70.41 TRINITY_DN32869_c0_g3_i1:510-1304(-)